MNTEQNQSQSAANPVRPAPGPRRSFARWLLLGVALLVLVAAGWKLAGTTRSPGPGMMPPQGTRVTMSPARNGSIDVTIDSLGIVTPERTVAVNSQVGGRVASVLYREGQMVAQGQPLVEIDTRPYEAQLLQAQGQLDRDQAQLNQARLDLGHYQDALKKNAIAKQTVEDQEQLVHQYEGTVKSDQGTIDYDRVQLGYCHITAPISGRLGLRLVDNGNVISAGSASTLVVITQENPTTVVFTVAQDDVPIVQKELSKGRTLRVDAYDRMQKNILATGRLLTFDNQIDTTTGTVKFRAEFDNAAGSLFPNQFVNARLWVKTIDGAVLVPTPAIQYNAQQAFLWVLDSTGAVHVHNVQVGDSNEKETSVTGVSAGDAVVTSNFDRLQEGGNVAVSKPGEGGMEGGPRP